MPRADAARQYMTLDTDFARNVVCLILVTGQAELARARRPGRCASGIVTACAGARDVRGALVHAFAGRRVTGHAIAIRHMMIGMAIHARHERGGEWCAWPMTLRARERSMRGVGEEKEARGRGTSADPERLRYGQRGRLRVLPVTARAGLGEPRGVVTALAVGLRRDPHPAGRLARAVTVRALDGVVRGMTEGSLRAILDLLQPCGGAREEEQCAERDPRAAGRARMEPRRQAGTGNQPFILRSAGPCSRVAWSSTGCRG